MPWNKDGTRKTIAYKKSSGFRMNYKNSAFPFKSPTKRRITDLRELQEATGYNEEELMEIARGQGTLTTSAEKTF